MKKLTTLLTILLLVSCSKSEEESEFACECERFKIEYSFNRPSAVQLRPCEMTNLEDFLLNANTQQLETQSRLQECD